MQVSVGMGDSPDPSKAGKIAGEEILSGITGDPDFVFVFIADGYHSRDKTQLALSAFKKEIGEHIPSIGCLSPDIFVSGNLPTIKGVAALALKGTEIKLYPAYGENFRKKHNKIANNFADLYNPVISEYEHNATVLLPSGPIYPPQSLDDLKVSNTWFAHKATPIFGAVTKQILSSQAKKGQGRPTEAVSGLINRLAKKGLENTIGGNSIAVSANYAYEFFNDKILENSVVACQLVSNTYKFGIGWSFAGKPIKDTLKVKKSIPGGIILEANEKNAVPAMLDATNIRKDELEPFFSRYAYALVYHLCVASDPSFPDDGYPYITIATPFLDGLVSMIPNDAIKSGSEVKIYSQSGDEILDSIYPCFDIAMKDIKKPEFALIFECANRAYALHDKIHQEMPIFEEILGEDTPFIGFGGGGEFSYKGAGYHYVNSTIHALVVGQ